MNITFGRYEAYERRIRTLARVLWWLVKHYLKIAIPTAVAAAALTFVGTVPGIVTEPVSCPDLVYGTAPTCSAQALMSDIVYEYAAMEEDAVWSTQAPDVAGMYRVRAVTKNGFGKPRYSEEMVFTIAPAPLQLQVNDVSCTYGDIAVYTAEQVSVQGLIGDDRLGEVSFAQEDVSICEMTVSLSHYTVVNAAGEDVTASYAVQTESGTLSFDQRAITLTSADAARAYDGTPLGVSDCAITGGSLASGNRIEYIPDETAVLTAVGECIAHFSAIITDEQGRDVTDNYAVDYVYGTLAVTPRPITLATRSETKQYDGIPLVATECVVTAGSLAKGEHIVYTGAADATVTSPGTVEADFDAVIVNEDGTDVTDRYQINKINGHLTVSPRPVTLTTVSAQKVYDGAPLLGEDYTIDEGTVAEGHTLALTFAPMPVDVGSFENTVSAQILDADGADVTPYYELTVHFGTLQIDPRPLKLVSLDATQVYTGQPLTAKEYRVSEGSVVEGHTVHATFAASQTDVGTCQNTFTVRITDAADRDVTQNYRLTCEYGLLQVTPILLTLRSESAQKVYDATALTKNKWTLVSGAAATGQKLVVKVTGSQTDAGESANTMTAIVRNAAGVDVTAAGYVITCEYGKLMVTPRPITLTSGTDEKEYDGTPLVSHRLSFKDAQLAADHTVFPDFTGSQTAPGRSDNTFTAKIRSVGKQKDVTANYEITAIYGTLTVTGRPEEGDDCSFDGTDPDDAANDSATLGIPHPSGERVFRAAAGVAGTAYLRGNAYGSYTGFGWAAAPVYDGNYTVNPMFYAGEVLFANSKTSMTNIMIEMPADRISQYVPYYTTQANAHISTGNDVNARYTARRYNLNASMTHAYEDFAGLLTPAKIRTEELAYRTFVYDHYLDVPADTAAVLRRLAAENGIRADSETLVTDIRSYIKGAAKYNLGTAPYPSNVDQVVYFLTVAKEGVCQQYASAATLMYRVFGIPARYTVGYVANLKGDGIMTDVLDSNAHAWVEIYLDGIGWVPIEVTGEGATGTISGGITSGECDGKCDGSCGGGTSIGRDDSMDDVVFYRVTTEQATALYLREISYGDYTGSGWKHATVYDVSGAMPLRYAGSALSYSRKYETQRVNIRALRADCPDLWPYYMSATGKAQNDVWVTTISNNATLYPYTGITYDDLKGLRLSNAYVSEELKYRTFVRQNYLTIPASTKAAMLELAAENGISSSSATVITDVQEYMQHAAKYNLDVAAYPEGVDTAVYFLTEAKEGYCQHFATAATMMYRALGIPARYTVGYMVETEAGESTEVPGKNAHAWVEVYVNGVGWIMMEVTAGYGKGVPTPVNDEGEPDENGEYEVLMRHDGTISITLTAASVEKVFDGRPVDAELSRLVYLTEGNLLPGHRIVAQTNGADTSVIHAGTRQVTTVESVQIVDMLGRDVTERYDITKVEGALTILKRPITIRSGSASKRVDGQPLTNSEWWISSGSMATGHVLEVTMSASLMGIGAKDNSFVCSITDVTTGYSVLSDYDITKIYGKLTITP